MFWTDEKVEELRKLWDKGLTANEIAKVLGVTKNAIVGKVHRLCLKARPSPIKTKGEETEDAANLFETGIVQKNIEASADEGVAALPQETVPTPIIGDKIKLVELDSHTCRWPVGDPREDDFGFCGKKVRTGQTYCDEHAAMAYVKAIRK